MLFFFKVSELFISNEFVARVPTTTLVSFFIDSTVSWVFKYYNIKNTLGEAISGFISSVASG